MSGAEAITFELSSDYATVRRILTAPPALRRMLGGAELPAGFDLSGPIKGIEYVLARESGAPVAVFVIASTSGGPELHFCFAPPVWGRTEPIARGFLAWLWAHTLAVFFLGHIPIYNRLALRLARRVGFREYKSPSAGFVWLEIRKP